MNRVFSKCVTGPWIGAISLGLLLSLIHFSLPTIVTFDSAHYHHFVQILEGKLPFSEWDIVRGPVFPTLILASKVLFGFGNQGFAVFTACLFLLTIVSGFRFLFQSASVLGLRSGSISLLMFFFGTDPLIVGYYHSLLTEFVAATIFMVSACLAIEWLRCNPADSRARHWCITGCFAILVTISYFLKQPYVMAAALPLLGAFFLCIFSRRRVGELLMRGLSVGLCMLVLGVSISVWESALPPEAKEKYRGRSSAALLSSQIVKGLRALAPVGSHGGMERPNSNVRQDDPEKMVLGQPAASCSQWFKLRNEDQYLLYECSTGSTTEALRFVAKSMVTFPRAILTGYVRSYLEIARARDFELFGFREHEAIAFRTFLVKSDLNNVFPIENPALDAAVQSYRLSSQAEPGGLVGRFPYLWFRHLSLKLFTWTILLAPLLLAISSLLLIIANVRPTTFVTRQVECIQLVWLLNFCVTIHVAIHGFMMATIDRYAFPVYPLGLLNVLCLLGFVGVRICGWGTRKAK